MRFKGVVLSMLSALACSEPDPIDLGIDPECNPLASSEECLFPYPSRFTQVDDPTASTGVRNAIPQNALRAPPSSPPLDYAPFNRVDGHSPAAPLLVHLGVDVDPAQLVNQRDTARSLEDGAPIAVFDMDSGERVPLLTEMDQNSRVAMHEGRHALIIRPMSPMRLGARHVAVMTTDLADVSGAPIAVPPGFAALRDGDITTHEALESSRDDYEAIFDFLAEHGYARDRLLLAWDFVVASESWVIGGMLSMREQALEVAAQGDLAYTIDRVIDAPNANVLRIVEGTFEVPTFLNAQNEIERTPDGAAVLQPERQSFPFTMIVPARAAAGVPLPLVCFGHGVFGEGRDYLEGSIGVDVIQPLAEEAGAVIVATDWIGLSSSDQDLLASELVEDINRVNVVTDRLQQALINNLVLIELVRDRIQNDPMVRVDEEPLLTDQVRYYGVSLGGIQGASLVSLSSRITRAVLAVPGGAWATLLTRSIVYSPVRELVNLRYPDPLLQQAFITLAQARFDGSDGVNVGQLLLRRPLPDAPSERVVLLQEAIGDCQVPNIASRILSRAMGLRLLGPEYEPVFGLETVAAPTSEPSLVQLAMPDRLADYSPPEDNVLPAEDNGTHSNAIALPHALDQVLGVLSDGMIVQTCDGPCDPD
jgi:hypothetical protein